MDSVAWDRKISDVNDGILIGVDKPQWSYYIALIYI